MILKKVLQGVGILAIILTLLPFIAVDYWWIRVFDFPHLQLTLFTFIALLIYFIKFDFRLRWDYIFAVLLLGCFVFQLTKIYPFTFLAPHEVLASTTDNADTNIAIYTANVLQTNKNSSKLSSELEGHRADIVLLTETDGYWLEQVGKELRSRYPYKVEVPKANTYGMLLYSKYELLDPEVKYLADKRVPSIHTKLVLPTKDTVQLYAIHPTPPLPGHHKMSTDRDSELMQIALESLHSELPVIVLGDFNDVAWSRTTKLFQGVSRLLDMRKGRGLFNTYDANNFMLRWPLDHIFISDDFRIRTIRLGNDIGSDHFPFFTQLTFEPGNAKEQRLDYPTEEEIETAKKQITKEEIRNRY